MAVTSTDGVRPRLVPALAMLAIAMAEISASAAAQQPAAIPYNATFVTKHAGVFGGERIAYTATVAPTILTDSGGAPAVNFVSTSYVRDDVRDPKNRPVIF